MGGHDESLSLEEYSGYSMEKGFDIDIIGWGCHGYRTRETQVRGDDRRELLLITGGIMKD